MVMSLKIFEHRVATSPNPNVSVYGDHVSRMSQEKLTKQALLAKVKGKRPVGRPRTR